VTTADRTHALEILSGLRDQLPPGHQDKTGVTRCVELLAADPTALEILSTLRDELPTGDRDKAGVIRCIELLRVSPPAPSGGAHAGYPQVMTWSNINFDRPVPLVPRSEVAVGDTIQSSHGYRGVVAKAETRGIGAGTTTFVVELHRRGSGVTRSESYAADLTIPVLAFAGQQHVVLVRTLQTGTAEVYGPFADAEDAVRFLAELAEADWWDGHEGLVQPLTPTRAGR
jgi:hypothetical protein